MENMKVGIWFEERKFQICEGKDLWLSNYRRKKRLQNCVGAYECD